MLLLCGMPSCCHQVRCLPVLSAAPRRTGSRLQSEGYAIVDEATVPLSCDDLPLSEVVQAVWPARFSSASAARKACRRSLVLVDENVGRNGQAVLSGCTLRLLQRIAAPSPGTGRRGRADAAALSVVYEDDSLAVVYKPAGPPMRFHEAREIVSVAVACFTRSGCLMRTQCFAGMAVQGASASAQDGPPLRGLLANSLEPSRDASAQPLWRPQHVHRLDAPTSGLLVVAKTGQSLRTLSASFKHRLVHKRYRAVVAGPVGEVSHMQLIEAPLSGQSARTHWRVVCRRPSAKFGEVALVDLWPYTGRTHQLRRHMALMGHPIVGDQKHWCDGLPEDTAHGLFLSAVELELPHPKTGALLRVRTAQPPGFSQYLKGE